MSHIQHVDRYQNSDTEYETPKGYHHPDGYYDDDEQPLYHDSRRSPKRRLLPATPQGITALSLQRDSDVCSVDLLPRFSKINLNGI